MTVTDDETVRLLRPLSRHEGDFDFKALAGATEASEYELEMESVTQYPGWEVSGVGDGEAETT